jgi:hypothetical protein
MKTTSFIAAISFVYLCSAPISSLAIPVTFKVDLGYQITNDLPTFDPLNDTVEIRGNFYSDWSSGIPLVQVGGTTSYTNTFNITTLSPGSLIQFKYHAYGTSGDNWENLQGYIYTNSGNRAFTLSSSAQALPLVHFNDQWGGSTPLTVQVDMTPQILVGNFVPGPDTLEVRGSWDGFSSGVMLTNNPASATSNIYSMTFDIPSPAPGGLGAYKFHFYGSHDVWEPIDNRSLLVSSPVTVQPLALFNNLKTNDLLFADTYVTFSVNMTNAVGIDNYVFNPNADAVYINDDFLGWWPWGYSPPPQYQLFPVGSSQIYTNTLLVPKGSPVALTYKYSIAEYGGIYAADNEAAFKVNHIRYTRNTGSCVLPLDTFGTQLVEPVVGSVKISSLVAGHVNVTWNGHLGIHLQTSTNLISDIWNDLPATETLSATNYPASSKATFFRLVKP